ncbi:MAG: hypothetical protein H7346_06105 [Burkholderiaceae bacterium]|nr:hypothetical protein [Burkholderiaceae bacterium]
MPRVDKFLAPEVQKHKRNAEYMEEGWGRKGGGKASGNRRSWAGEERQDERRKYTGNRSTERGLS